MLYDLPPVRPLPLPPDGGAHADAAEAGVSVVGVGVVGVPVGGVGLAGAGGGTGGGVVWRKENRLFVGIFFKKTTSIWNSSKSPRSGHSKNI